MVEDERGEQDGGGGAVFETETGDDESPSGAVVRAVAAVTGTEPMHVDMHLHEILNPEVVDRLLTDSARKGRTETTLSFSYDDYDVTVTSHGDIRLCERRGR